MKTLKTIIAVLLCLLAVACQKKENAAPAKPAESPLAITYMDRNQGAMNDSLTILGSGFSTDTGNDKVTINGVRALIIRATATEIKVLVPARAFSGNVNVQVGNNLAKGPAFQYNITSGVVTTLAGSTTSGYADGVGTNARFYSPQALALDSSGNLYVGDVLNYRIRKVTVNNGTVTSFAGSGNLNYADGPGQLNQFAYTSGIVVDKTGKVYVADNVYNNIRSISSDGTQVTNIVGTANGTGGYVDGSGAQVRFSAPNGLVFDRAGNLFIVDQHNRAIRKLTFPNTVSTFVAENTSLDFGVAWGITCYLPDDNIYVADIFHNWVDRIYNNGGYILSFGNGMQGYKDGLGTLNAEFNGPSALAIDNQYDIYVADSGNNCIRMIDGQYNVITIAGSPAGGYFDGAGTAAKFNNPTGIAVDNVNHYLYVADAGNNCIRKIALE